MTDGIELREMSVGDYDRVLPLWQREPGIRLRNADSREAIAAYLNRNPGLSFVAVKDGIVIGAILVGTDGRRGYLQHVVVTDELRSRGIGRALVRRSLAALKRESVLKAHLFVVIENHAAMDYWKKAGWQERSEIKMFSFVSSDDPNE